MEKRMETTVLLRVQRFGLNPIVLLKYIEYDFAYIIIRSHSPYSIYLGGTISWLGLHKVVSKHVAVSQTVCPKEPQR